MICRAVPILCFLSARNLGDAVFHADFLRALVRAGYAERYIVWTFREAAFLFEGLEHCTIFTSDFPIGATMRRFAQGGFVSFWSTLRRIRRERPTETLELVSDIRERWTCRLIGAERDLSPAWAPGHPFRAHNRMGRFKPSSLVTIPATTVNLYAAYDLVLQALVGPTRGSFAPAPQWPAALTAGRDDAPLRIGIHPSASARCKLWPQSHWLRLIDGLLARYPNATFTFFGAPSERSDLEPLAARAGPVASISTTSLKAFASELDQLDLLIGLDSFSVHLANSKGVPAIVLVGPNDPRLFSPPGARDVVHPKACIYQPCGGRPRCIGTDFQFACMTAITPDEVLARIAPAPFL